MKRSLLALATLVVCSTLSAQSKTDDTTLRQYASKMLPRCPAGVLTLEPVAQQGPANFRIYGATVRSSDQYCGTQKYLLHSPRSGQVLIGTVIALPADNRPATTRVAEKASELLQQQLKVTVAPFPLPDGLKAVAMIRTTEWGPFAYNGYIDQSERFLIVGSRGNVQADTTKAIREALAVATNGVRRGTGKIEILEISDFQCPTCARAHEKLEPVIQKNLSKVNYIRLDLPLFEHHEWAVPATLGGRAVQKVAPAKYWQYVDTVFKNQEQIGKQTFAKWFPAWLEDNDIDAVAIEKIYRSPAERKAVMDQVSRAFDLGINSTPTFIVNGQVLGFGPDGAFTIDAIKTALGVPVTPAPKAKPAAAPKKK